jgi:hypothetical protein
VSVKDWGRLKIRCHDVHLLRHAAQYLLAALSNCEEPVTEVLAAQRRPATVIAASAISAGQLSPQCTSFFT